MVCWKIEFGSEAAKEFSKLSKDSQRLIQTYLNKVLKLKHPKDLGKVLRHNLKGCWRYRVDKFRVICEIQEDKLVILVIRIGKRDKIYED